jgi:hypothetical protein
MANVDNDTILKRLAIISILHGALPQASLGCDKALEAAAPHGSCGSYLSIRAAAFEPRIKHGGRIR